MLEEKLLFFKDKLEKQYGKELTEKIYQGYNNRKTTFRVNTLKSNCTEIESILIKNGLEFEKVEYLDNAYILKNENKKELEKLKIYDEGKIYIQSLSSMLPPIILNPKENEDILDMAAAPGGKTTQIAALVKNKANITACEINSIRVEKLRYNVEKQGANSVYVMVKDARQLDDFLKFDKILLDAPCSGSGTLNFSDSKVEKYFTPKLIEKSKKMQISLLNKAVKLIKSGQKIVYSTCSVLEEENEEIINVFLKNKTLKIVPIEIKGIDELPLLPTKIDGTIGILPNKIFEGFFVAKLQKI